MFFKTKQVQLIKRGRYEYQQHTEENILER